MLEEAIANFEISEGHVNALAILLETVYVHPFIDGVQVVWIICEIFEWIHRFISVRSTNCVSEMVNSANVRTCRCIRGFLLADYWPE